VSETLLSFLFGATLVGMALFCVLLVFCIPYVLNPDQASRLELERRAAHPYEPPKRVEPLWTESYASRFDDGEPTRMLRVVPLPEPFETRVWEEGW
jgi:hypothetical protein